MKKKWKNILIVSLILIFIEAGAAIGYALPIYYKTAFFNAIEETKLDTAQELLNKDFGIVKLYADMDLDDYIVYHSNQYLEDQVAYEDTKTILINLEHMDGYKGKTEAAFGKINEYELLKIYEDAARDYEVNSGGRTDYVNEDIHLNYVNTYHCESNLFNYYENFSADYCTKIADAMDAYLEKKFDAFQNGELEYSKINAYVQVAYQYFPETEYAKGLVSQLMNVGALDSAFSGAQKSFDAQEYVECIRQCDTALESYKNESYFELYKDKLDSLRAEAYEAGKTFYKDKISEMVDDEKIDEAKALIDSLKNIYGKDINIAELEALTVPDWKKLYKGFMADYKEKLAKMAGDGVKAADTFDSKDVNVEEHMPLTAAVKDLDGDEIPELLLYDQSMLYVMRADFDGVHLTGAITYTGFSGEKLVAIGGGDVEDIFTLIYDDGEWALDASFKITEADGEKTYYYNGDKVTEEAYTEKKNSILDKRTNIEDGVPVDDAAALFE